jgi:hypothetical protein
VITQAKEHKTLDIISALIGQIQPLVQVVIAAAGTAIAILAFRVNRQGHRESWLRNYRELHELFWTDQSLKDVRHWLASDRAYRFARAALLKRRRLEELKGLGQAISDDDYLTDEEYEVIEKLDRFLNFVQRVQIVVVPEFRKKADFWSTLFFAWWLVRCRSADREEIHWYIRTCYPDIENIAVKDIGQLLRVVAVERSEKINLSS